MTYRNADSTHRGFMSAANFVRLKLAAVRSALGEAFGYELGDGGAVTQATSKSTGVTLNKPCGNITMHNASLATNTTVSFTLTNDKIANNDGIIVNVTGTGTTGAYLVFADTIAAGSCVINLRNITGGSLGEAVVLSFQVIKSQIA